ncbi:rdx domain containing protein [Dermatophagoides farinae]|uniref:Rdx domain containing protein n=1 Tax=Dermatophagoides farinae TaxID=6954 RepID=A0A9D4SJE5_DERFA|nr:rdx domain containing protein [Dermatophagoides farinae]
MDRNICFILFAIFVAYTARDLFFKSYQPSSQADAIDSVKKEIPSMSFRQQRPTIKILYCYSCGYQRAFEEYRKMIMDQFPDLTVIGSNYNPSFLKSKLAQLISITKMIAIALLVANVNPFAYFGLQTPHFWEWMREHKLYACMMTFFLANTLESQLICSHLVKITTGRIPSANELIDMIDNQHKFFQPETFGTGGSGDHLTSHTIHTTGRTL